MKNIGYYNGKVGEVEKMTIPMNDRATYFGDGVYDATHAVNKKIFALDEHIDRFYLNCNLLKIPFDMPKEELADLLQKLVDQEDSKSQFVYWQATRGTDIRDHTFPEHCKPNLLITITDKPMKDMKNVRYRLLPVEDTRFLHCNIKTLNLLPSVMAKQAAKQAGCDEAVFHRGDMITECSHSNISIIKDGCFITAPLNNLILPGITRGHLIQLAHKVGMPVYEQAFTLDELMNCDEAIVSSCGALCMGVDEIAGKPVGGRAAQLLRDLQDAYEERFVKVTGSMF